MGFKIQDITSVSPEPGRTYFLDCNIWLCILNSYYSNSHRRKYTNFFSSIQLFPGKPKPRIALPAILVSEIVNRIMRDIYFKDFQAKFPHLLMQGNDRENYKKVYRQHQQYITDYNVLCYEIKGHHLTADFVSDDFDSYTFKEIFKSPNTGLDFNDFIYTLISKKKDLVIVTDDSDFKVEDVDIITANSELLKL